MAIATDTTKEITTTYLINENLMALEYQAAPGYEKTDSKASCVIACFTTAHGMFDTSFTRLKGFVTARLKLYKELERLQTRVLYFDTDSIIYIQQQDGPVLETGPLLGQLSGKYIDVFSNRYSGDNDVVSDEILQKYGPQACISAFNAAGPKTYMLTITDRETGDIIDTVMKHKGIRPARNTFEVLNPTTMVQSIRDKTQLAVPQMNMVRDRKTGTIHTRYMDKTLRVTFSKRVLPNSLESVSLPIGYKL